MCFKHAVLTDRMLHSTVKPRTRMRNGNKIYLRLAHPPTRSDFSKKKEEKSLELQSPRGK